MDGRVFKQLVSLKSGSSQTSVKALPVTGSSYKLRHAGLKRRNTKGFLQPVESPSRYLISPTSLWYRGWWYFTTFCSLVTGFFTPWEVAFEKHPGLRPYNDFPAIVEYFLLVVFVTDILVHFCLPRHGSNGLLETRWESVALRYLGTWFIMDLLGVLPMDVIATETGITSDVNTLRGVGLLRLFRLLRLHRIFRLFAELEETIHFPTVATTLLRNMTIVVLVGHFAGCMFYFISLWYDFSERRTWIGAEGDTWDLDEMSDTEKYIISFYYSITTMTTVGYGEFNPGNTAEVVFATVYMLFNIVLNSYILGTITLVVIKADEQCGNLRRMFKKIKYFASLDGLEASQQETLKNYVQFSLANPNLQEGPLLEALPHGTRRNVFKTLYIPLLEKLDILQGTSKGFLLRLLEHATIDIYMPNQVIICEGDYVHEMHIMLTGQAATSSSGNGNQIAASPQMIDEGCAFGTDSFFNLEEMSHTIRSHTICRIMIIPRASYIATCDEFPKDKVIVDNTLLSRTSRTAPYPPMPSSRTPEGSAGDPEDPGWWNHEREKNDTIMRSPFNVRDSVTSRNSCLEDGRADEDNSSGVHSNL